jgi:hypothetical protein
MLKSRSLIERVNSTAVAVPLVALALVRGTLRGALDVVLPPTVLVVLLFVIINGMDFGNRVSYTPELMLGAFVLMYLSFACDTFFQYAGYRNVEIPRSEAAEKSTSNIERVVGAALHYARRRYSKGRLSNIIRATVSSILLTTTALREDDIPRVGSPIS